jgi:hypothetical protein
MYKLIETWAANCNVQAVSNSVKTPEKVEESLNYAFIYAETFSEHAQIQHFLKYLTKSNDGLKIIG